MTTGLAPDARLERQAAQLIRSPFLGGGREAAARIPALDWPLVVEAADRNGLAHLLYSALKAAGRADEPPSEVRERLRQAYLRADIANWLAYQELGHLLDGLAAENIPVVLLKGCALAGTLYGDAALRPMHNLDVLTPQADAGRLGGLLQSLGYTASAELTEGFGQNYLQRLGQGTYRLARSAVSIGIGAWRAAVST